jgi:uncharacterized protein DUF2760
VTPLPDSPAPSNVPLPFTTRLWFAWVCWWSVLFDAQFAATVHSLRADPRLLAGPSKQPHNAGPAAGNASPTPSAASPAAGNASPTPSAAHAPAPVKAADVAAPALQLLALLQREGRLVDFLQQDIGPFSDAQIGQVARVVHSGCRRALAGHAEIAPVLAEAESTRIELAQGFDATAVKLTGDVAGSPPFRGVVRHRGWRATRLSLPTALAGHDPHILAQAEVEL